MFLTMKYGVYFFFSSLMLLSSVFVFFLIPETKSVPLESMDRLFEVKPVWAANKKILEELQAQDEAFRNNVQGVDFTEAAKRQVEQQETV